jgi:hypothetical protein
VVRPVKQLAEPRYFAEWGEQRPGAQVFCVDFAAVQQIGQQTDGVIDLADQDVPGERESRWELSDRPLADFG